MGIWWHLYGIVQPTIMYGSPPHTGWCCGLCIHQADPYFICATNRGHHSEMDSAATSSYQNAANRPPLPRKSFLRAPSIHRWHIRFFLQPSLFYIDGIPSSDFSYITYIGDQIPFQIERQGQVSSGFIRESRHWGCSQYHIRKQTVYNFESSENGKEIKISSRPSKELSSCCCCCIHNDTNDALLPICVHVRGAAAECAGWFESLRGGRRGSHVKRQLIAAQRIEAASCVELCWLAEQPATLMTLYTLDAWHWRDVQHCTAV